MFINLAWSKARFFDFFLQRFALNAFNCHGSKLLRQVFYTICLVSIWFDSSLVVGPVNGAKEIYKRNGAKKKLRTRTRE